MHVMIRIFLALFFCFPPLANAADWGAFSTPTHTKEPQVLGGYTTGCVDGAQALPNQGEGYIKVRRERGRAYGHPKLINFIEAFSRVNYKAGNGVLLISDLAQPRGGFHKDSSHRSHTNGLDVDIWMIRTPDYVPYDTLETTSADSVLSENKQSLNPDVWQPSMAKSLRLAALHNDVERIFIHPVIKKEMCRLYKGKTWMSKLRPWWGHHRHFHVRLGCPKHSPHCVKQSPPPKGDGCDATNLANWIRDVTKPAQKTTSKPKKPGKKVKKKPRKMVAACNRLLQ